MSSTPARTCFSPVNVVCVPGAIVGMTGAAPGRADVSPSTANAVEPAPEPAAIAVAPTLRPTALLNVRLLIMSESSLQSCLPTLVRPSVGHISHMTPRLRRVRRSPYAVIRLFSQRDGGAILEDSRGPAADGPACPKGLVVNRTPVVLIHGAWLHKSSWESWAERFASSGFAVHVPGWPGEAASARLSDRHVVRAPPRLLAALGFGPDAPRGPAQIVVDTVTAARGPLLFVSGQEDRVIPDAVTRAAYKAYGDSAAVTDLKQFADRGHSLVIDSGWRTVAGYVLAWLAANGVEAVTEEDPDPAGRAATP